MRGAILVRAFQLQHDIAGAVELEPIISDGGTCDIAAQLFEFMALIHGAAHLGVEAESLRVGTALFGRLHLTAGDRLQRQHFLTCAWSECNAIGASGRLQRSQGGIFATLSLLRLLSSQHFRVLAFAPPGTHPSRSQP